MYSGGFKSYSFCILPTNVTDVVDTDDIIDEALYYFKANVFFKNYEIKVKYISTMHKYILYYLHKLAIVSKLITLQVC